MKMKMHSSSQLLTACSHLKCGEVAGLKAGSTKQTPETLSRQRPVAGSHLIGWLRCQIFSALRVKNLAVS